MPLSRPASSLLLLLTLGLAACGTRGRGSGDDDVSAPDDDDDDDASASEDPCDMDCVPQVLAEDLETTRTVHADASWVYFSAWFGPQLQRVPRWGGTIELLREEGLYGSSFVVSDGSLYYPSDDQTMLYRSATDGTDVQTLATGLGAADGLAVDGEYLYFADTVRGEIGKVPLDGGEPQVLAAGVSGARDLRMDETDIYFTRGDGADVMRLDKDGGSPTVLSSGHGVPYGALAMDDETVFFTSLGGETSDDVLQVPKAGGETRSIRNSGALAIAVSDEHMYWTYGLGREIRRTTKDAEGAVEQLVDIGTYNGPGDDPFQPTYPSSGSATWSSSSSSARVRSPRCGGLDATARWASPGRSPSSCSSRSGRTTRSCSSTC